MGGRLDATNIAEPAISVITDIDFDHQKFLGNTLPEIAREKAGIIRPNGTVVLLPQHPQVNDTLGKEIMARNARPVSAVQYMPPLTPAAHNGSKPGEGSLTNSFPLAVGGEEITITPPLPGRHQFRNLALAIAAAQELNQFGLRILPQHIERGVRETQWPARFQVIAGEGASSEIVLDVAHNPAGAWALRSTLSERYGYRPLTFVFGAMRDKAISEIAGILFPLAEQVILTQADNPRAATPAELKEAAQHTGADLIEASDVPSALERARQLAGSNGVIVITGSIYIVGEALKLLSVEPSRQGAVHHG